MAIQFDEYRHTELPSFAREIVKLNAQHIDSFARKQREETSIPAFYLKQPGSALNVTLSELQMLWRSRFGDTWVSEGDTANDEFYRIAARRLHAAGQLERLTINQGAALFDVYRIRDADADR